MKPIRYSLLLIFALVVPACGGKKSTVINQITNGSPGTTIQSPFPVTGPGAGDVSGLDQSGGVAGLGSEGQPRTVFLSSDGTNFQIRFSRRNADGTWTPVLAISTYDTDVKENLSVYVTRNNNYTHIFWLQGATLALLRLHYAQVDNSATPALTVGDTNISTGTTTNVTVAALYGLVSAYTTAIDPVTNNIYALWVQSMTDGGMTTTVPLVGAVIAGAGLFTERFALLSPTGAGFQAASVLPILKVASSGRVHAAWAQFGSGVVHRLRTAVNTWSVGNRVSTVIAFNSIQLLDLALAPNGNAYATFVTDALNVGAAFRPAGDASIFAPDVLATTVAAAQKLIAVLEPGTENFHILVGKSGAVGNGLVVTARNPGAGLSGAWEVETLIDESSIKPGSEVDFFAWADSTNTVAVVVQSPSVFDELPKILSTTRPTGAGNGRYTAFADLTAPGALPCTNVTLATNSLGAAMIAWEQGQDHVVPLGEIYGALYSPGGSFGGTFNLSETPAVGSHGPITALLTDSGAGVVSWLEAVASGPDLHDVYFALKP